MAVLPILQYPNDKRLREVSLAVEAITPEIEQDIQNIIDTAEATPNTAGLAAPQVGILKRIFVAASEMEEGTWNVYINPEMLNPEGQTNGKEACLSVPGNVRECVRRAETITFRYMKPDGSTVEESLKDFPAKCAQHEIDHLDGILFIDHLSKIRRQTAEKKIERYHRKNKG